MEDESLHIFLLRKKKRRKKIEFDERSQKIANFLKEYPQRGEFCQRIAGKNVSFVKQKRKNENIINICRKTVNFIKESGKVRFSSKNFEVARKFRQMITKQKTLLHSLSNNRK